MTKREEKLLIKIQQLEKKLSDERQSKKACERENQRLHKRLCISENKAEELELKLRDEIKKKVSAVMSQIASLGIDMKNL